MKELLISLAFWLVVGGIPLAILICFIGELVSQGSGPVISPESGTCSMRTDEGVEKYFAPDDRFGSRNAWHITEDDRAKMRIIGWSERTIQNAICYKVEELND